MPAPSLELDWELGAFRALRALWRRMAPRTEDLTSGRAARLADHAGALQVLASLVAGAPVRVLPARGAGGVRGHDLLVPPSLDLAPDSEANRGLYLLRVVLGATIARLGLAQAVPEEPGARLAAELKAALYAAAVLRGELAAFGPAWDEARTLVLAHRPPPGTLRGRAAATEVLQCRALAGEEPWQDPAAFAALARLPWRGPPVPAVALWGGLLGAAQEEAGTGGTTERGGPPEGTEIDAPPVEALRRVLLDPKAQEDKVLQHSFEKVETADTWQGNVLNDDGADELEDQLEALEEVELGALLRGGSEAHSIYRADVGLGTGIPDVQTIAPGEQGIAYDEWDHRARAYRPGWCTVYPAAVQASCPAWAQEARARHRRLITQLRRRLEHDRARRCVIDRQLDGDEPDITALVDQHAAVRAGRTGDDRLYLRHVPRRRDFATTVLLDVSLSADAWVDDRRVLDVAREAVLVLGEASSPLGDRIEVLAFASSTRNRCRVWSLKDWHEPRAVGADRLGALEPQGYTRIGAAIRHAAAGLARTPAEARLLLLVTDGKPTDQDRYEGPYGVADVRMALREAERMGIVAHALAIDAAASAWLPAMLGAGRSHLLPTPDHLPAALTEVYGRLTS